MFFLFRLQGVSDLFEELSAKVDLDDEEKRLLLDVDKWNSRRIPVPIVYELKTALLAYLSFKKKEKSEKLEKLKQSKEALPVFQFRFLSHCYFE